MKESTPCPYCGMDMNADNREPHSVIREAGLRVTSEHVGPGGRMLGFDSGQVVQLADMCPHCDAETLRQKLFTNRRDSKGDVFAELEEDENVTELANQCRSLRARVAGLKTERDRLRWEIRNAPHSPECTLIKRRFSDHISSLKCDCWKADVNIHPDTDCCGQPDQCWEPCGELGKSEAHARPESPRLRSIKHDHE